jgi:hypothetical protein
VGSAGTVDAGAVTAGADATAPFPPEMPGDWRSSTAVAATTPVPVTSATEQANAATVLGDRCMWLLLLVHPGIDNQSTGP